MTTPAREEMAELLSELGARGKASARRTAATDDLRVEGLAAGGAKAFAALVARYGECWVRELRRLPHPPGRPRLAHRTGLELRRDLTHRRIR